MIFNIEDICTRRYLIKVYAVLTPTVAQKTYYYSTIVYTYKAITSSKPFCYCMVHLAGLLSHTIT